TAVEYGDRRLAAPACSPQEIRVEPEEHDEDRHRLVDDVEEERAVAQRLRVDEEHAEDGAPLDEVDRGKARRGRHRRPHYPPARASASTSSPRFTGRARPASRTRSARRISRASDGRGACV